MIINHLRFLKYLCGLLLIVLSIGCKTSTKNGELIGVRLDKLKTSKTPYGMVLVPGGTFIMGQSDEDITFSQTAQNRQVTIAPFYIDDSEISNSEYRQFVYWVRDSIMVTDYLGDPSYFLQSQTQSNSKYIDWEKVRRQSPWRSTDPNVKTRLESMYYQGEDKVFGKNEMDVRLIHYHYEWYDLENAIRHKNDKNKKRSDFIYREKIDIYPDTTVWMSDFHYAANEPLVKGYFSHPSYDEYPVVGVSWKQAQAFNAWRTQLYNNQAAKNKRPQRFDYQLPTEAEWEYAARGGRVGSQFPWGGPTARNARGCLMANFKPGRGNYMDDGYAYTAPVYSYFPNDYGLYNMSGNVSEWTQSSYDESGYSYVHDMNPTYNYSAKDADSETMKRKVIRGGSWKDVGFFLQNGTRQYEYQDTAKSYIGFRSVTRVAGSSLR
jgi:sulfatase modifying factor 1